MSQQQFTQNKKEPQKNAINKKAIIPKKSASIIICRKREQQQQPNQPNQQSNQQTNNDCEYDILMLRRHIKLSFGGMHSFPGGNMDKEDEQFTEQNKQTGNQISKTQLKYKWQDALFYTCARELFEEIGFFIADINQQDKIIQFLNNKDKLEFHELFSYIQPNIRSFFTPFLRIITIQNLPRRWDTQFFIVQINETINNNNNNQGYQVYNIGKYLQTKNKQDLHNTNDLIINPDESDQYSWETPLSALTKHGNKEIKLPIPQVLICNLMLQLETIESVQKYLMQIEEQHNNLCRLGSNDNLRKNPATFPFILEIKGIGNKKLRLIMCGDEEYPSEKILDGEEDGSQFKQELTEAFRSVKIQKGQFLRLETDFINDIITNISCDFLAPFTLLTNINLSNVQNIKIKQKPKL